MATDELIANLVRDLRPVHPLRVPRARLTQWGLVVVAAMAVGTAGLGARANLLDSLATLPFPAHSILLLLVAVFSAVAAVAMSTPGEPVESWRRWAPVVSALAWAAWLVGELGLSAANGAGVRPGIEGVGCVAKALAFAVTPGLVLTVMVGRGLPSDTRTTMVFTALAAAAVGALGVELTCPVTSPSHLLVWHGGPVVAAVLAAWIVGRTTFDKVTLALSRTG